MGFPKSLDAKMKALQDLISRFVNGQIDMATFKAAQEQLFSGRQEKVQVESLLKPAESKESD